MRNFAAFMIAVVLMLVVLAPASGDAADGPVVIRDAESENIIRSLATPLFQAAGIPPDSVQLHILQDKSLNAFVSNGMQMYLNTGLLMRAETANQLAGVIAHETGHIAGGHLVTLKDQIELAQIEALLATVLGTAAAVATGRGDVGSGMVLAGQQAAMRSLFTYTRGQEQSADQAAVRLLDSTHQSSKGLLEFFEILGDQEMLNAAQQDPYVRTHPLTRDRVEFVRHHGEGSAAAATPSPAAVEERHQRMRAKLYAFLEPPVRTLARYKETDTSVPARYARAVAYYRKADLAKALPLIDALMAEAPKDPYFAELKGQMLFENGRLAEAVAAYRQAVRLSSDQPLLRVALAQAMIETEDNTLLREASQHLTVALGSEPGSPFAWRLLSIAHGRNDDMGMAAYAMAEYALLARKPSEAIHHAERALTLLPAGSPKALRVHDIRDQAEYAVKQRKK